MQDIIFYVAAKETHGIVRDSANANSIPAPNLVIGVSVCLKMRLFAACGVSTPYPVSSLGGVLEWKWRMDDDFNRNTPCKLVADAEDISVQTVTDTVEGESLIFTEFEIPISNMNTQELTTWLGNARKRSGLIGELVGYDSDENAVFVLQIDDFTVWNRVAGLADPTALDQEILTRSETVQMIREAVSSSAATKQDMLTSANAGTNISIDENGIISNTYSLPYATASESGGVVLATAAETIAGSNAAKAVTPASFMAALNGNAQIVAQSALQSFQAIDDLGFASTVSLASGKACKLNAISGNHYLTVPDVPAGKYGMDAHLELFVGTATLVHTLAPLVLMDALVPNAVNDCVIKYRDGTARMFVEDHAYGYVVTVAGGTEGTQLDGSLYFGLTGSTQSYVVFANSLNGQTFVLPEETIINRSVSVVGNGYSATVLSGGISCTSKTTFSNLGMNGVSVLDGTATFGDVFIPEGGTVSVVGGGLAVEKVTGNGGVIDLGGTNISVSSGVTAYVSGCTFTGGGQVNYGGAFLNRGTLNFSSFVISGNSANIGGGGLAMTNSASATLTSAVIVDNSASSGGAIYANASSFMRLDNAIVSGNTATSSGGGAYINSSSVLEMSASLVSGNTAAIGSDLFVGAGASAVLLGGTTVGGCILHSGGIVEIAGQNRVGSIEARSAAAGNVGSVIISSGAIVDLTGNTNNPAINPGGGITFESGGATVQLGSSAGTVDSSYMMDNVTLPAGAKLTNTNVVDLAEGQIITQSGAKLSASGVCITGGIRGLYGYGSMELSNVIVTGNHHPVNGGGVVANATTVLSNCLVSGNIADNFGGGIQVLAASVDIRGTTVTENTAKGGGGLYVTGGTTTVFDSVITGNTATAYGQIGFDAYQSAGIVTISASTVGKYALGNNAEVHIGGTCKVDYIHQVSDTSSGTAIISSGAIVDLTGNSNATPIAPEGGITLYGGSASRTQIYGSAGSATQLREFGAEATITGSAVTQIGAISGATVSLASSSCQVEFIKSGETAISSAFVQANETPYVLETEQGTGAVLVRVIED